MEEKSSILKDAWYVFGMGLKNKYFMDHFESEMSYEICATCFVELN